MSHFSVAVFTQPGGKTVEELLAPFQENNMGDCPKMYLSFIDAEAEGRLEYQNESVEMVKTPDGRLLFSWDEAFRVSGSIGCFGGGTHRIPDGYHVVRVPFSEKYSSFDEFMQNWHGYSSRDSETGKYGYWENPNAKWDYWRIGGRCRGLVKAKKGTLGELAWEHTIGSDFYEDKESHFDSATIEELDFNPNLQAYNRALRFWEVAIEGKPLCDGEKMMDFRALYKREWYLKRYGDKETYAKTESSFSTFAVVTPDGKWYQQGDMGWWGVSSETHDEALDWLLHYKERFIDTVQPNWTLTVVDCHI